jgi:hypothetical protein
MQGRALGDAGIGYDDIRMPDGFEHRVGRCLIGHIQYMRGDAVCGVSDGLQRFGATTTNMDIAASGSKILGQHPAKSAATTGNQNSLSRQIHLSLPLLFSRYPMP